MDNIATITKKGDTVKVCPASKPQSAMYTFKNGDGNIIGEYTTVIPAALTSSSAVARQIKQLIDPDCNYKPNILNKEFANIKELLQIQYENIVFKIEEEANLKEQNQQAEHDKKLKQASIKLQSLAQPLIYIGSLVDWLTAGERNNILFAFIVYAGQVIINNPISMIVLGEASSGKSHIQTTALKLIPSEYILNEKKITEAALFNRAKLDKYFYDGKIVNYGDMGGANDHEFIQESKNLMKELQSDGYLNKPLNIPAEEGGWKVEDLELIGRPCLTYTTVPNHRFDDQEMSRSIFITPRMDNKEIYNKMNSVLEFQYGRTYKTMEKYENELEIVPYMILHLKEVLRDYTIINPYVNFVIQFLSKSNYYKRDFPKYNGLLKTITALNFYNNIRYDLNGEKLLFTSIADVQLFITLLRPYHESISANIPPKAVEVLNDFRMNIEKWSSEATAQSLFNGVTTTEYFSKSELGLSKESVKRYIYELHEKGYLEIVDRVGKANVYNLASNELQIINNDLRSLGGSLNQLIVNELGADIAELIYQEDKFVDDLDIMNQDDTVMKPIWLE